MTLKLEYLDFIVVREEWSVYRLSSGTIVRVKILPTRFVRKDENRFSADFKTIIDVTPSDEDRGVPTPPTPSKPMTPEDILGVVKFTPIREAVNIYDIPDARMIIILVLKVEQIIASKRFNEKGVRIFDVKGKVGLASIRYPR